MFKLSEPKTTLQIANEWDQLASIRLQQISSGEDITYNKVLMPTIMSIVENLSPKNILDVGCGVGVLSNQLSKFADKVIGIDPSKNSIKLANERFGDHVTFFDSDIETFDYTGEKFDLVVANMVLMDCHNVKDFCGSLRRHSKSSGKFVWSVTHPFFWPKYYGYDEENWFDYTKEQFIEGPFRISKDSTTQVISTHVHRPLSMLLNSILEAGFDMSEIREPMPSKKIEGQYPKEWGFPRYLIGVSANR